MTSPTIEAMQKLRPSGDRSFEELMAQLLSRVSGEKIRRCKSGSQGGIDALAEIPFAIEMKRYEGTVRSRDLVGGLTSAATDHPELQLWIVVATSEIAAQTYDDLKKAGLRLGIAVQVLDTLSGPDLSGVSNLVALAATDIDTTLNVLGDPKWREDGPAPDLDAIHAELTRVRSLPQFGTWEDRLRREVRELPTWHRLIRRQNERVLTAITDGDARIAFGTQYDPAEAVPRSAETRFTEWWESCGTSGLCPVAVATGDRYDGKTWLVYRWLSANLDRLTVPVFFFSSHDVQALHGDLRMLLMREAEEALGTFADHAKVVIERQRSAAGSTPWCIIILDGADEYFAVPRALGNAVRWAIPGKVRRLVRENDRRTANITDDPAPRPCGVLVTCRTRDFDDASQWLGGRAVKRVELGPFDEREFLEALRRRSIDPKELEHLPAAALEMIHRPRYLDLMVRHRNELSGFAGITVDVLHYLDATDKVAPRANLPEVLGQLARAWTNGRRLNHAAIHKHLHPLTDQVERDVRALMSEGVLTRQQDGTYMPDPGKLALGMGLFIREELLSVQHEAELPQKLADFLKPNPDDDEKVRWLRAAVSASLLAGDASDHPRVVQVLLATWLSARNFSSEDLRDLRNLSPLVLKPLMQLLPTSIPRTSNVMLFAEAVITAELARNETAVAEGVRRWVRTVPAGAQHMFDEEDEAPESIATRMEDRSFRDLALELPEEGAGNFILECQRLALLLACQRPSLMRPIDVMAVYASRDVVYDRLDSGERFAVRMIIADTGPEWFQNDVHEWFGKPKAARTRLLRDLIHFSRRNDLLPLLADLPPWSYGFDRPQLRQADIRELQPDINAEQMLRNAGKARFLALDPEGPAPPRPWRNALSRAALAHLSDARELHLSRPVMLDDHELEQAEPALAAWAPDAGARIVRTWVEDIPRRNAAGENIWAFEIEGHVALLTPRDRRMLLEAALAAGAKPDNAQHAGRVAYRCVIAGSAPATRVRLLLRHPFGMEWNMFYDVLDASADPELRSRAAAAVRRERDPLRLRRARYLLGNLGGAELSGTDLARLVSALSNDDDRDAARFLLRHSRVDDATPAAALGPLVSVARTQAEEAWQYTAFLDRMRRPGVRGAEWLARALSAPLTARQRGAGAGSLSDEAAVMQGIEQLANEIAERLARSIKNRNVPRDVQQFPETFAREISESTFDRWVSLISSETRYTQHVLPGLLVPVVRQALRTGHPAARNLWALAYPFQRERVSLGMTFSVEGGLDWTLAAIHDPELDDDLATQLLRELVADCRSDSELVSVALGARLESMDRLTRVVREGLESERDVDRARARFLAGWMLENQGLRESLAKPDRSAWVENVGQGALWRLNQERWGRHRLRTFLSEPGRTPRWAAGRLFLACADAATPLWAGRMIHETSGAPATRRAEAKLLIGRVRKKADDSELRDKFLGHSVRELSAVAPPWRQAKQWDDVAAASAHDDR